MRYKGKALELLLAASSLTAMFKKYNTASTGIPMVGTPGSSKTAATAIGMDTSEQQTVGETGKESSSELCDHNVIE